MINQRNDLLLQGCVDRSSNLAPNFEPTTCRVCNCASLVTHFTIRTEYLDRCSNCGFIQVRHMPNKTDLDQIYSTSYFEHAKYRDRRAIELENLRRLRLLEAVLTDKAMVLDAGCSVGDFFSMAKARYTIFGLDLSDFAIDQARAANPEIADHLVSGRLEDTPFANQQFDAICLWDVIEHLWDPVPVLVDLVARLKPGGYLFISTPAIDTPVARIAGRYWAFMTPPEHLVFFTRRTFKILFDEKIPARTVQFFRRGKWANVAFIGYKIKRIMPGWLPQWFLAPLAWPLIRHLNIYVPTGDIQYLVIQKPGQES